MNYHQMITSVKKVIYPRGESYVFGGRKLRFAAGSRPIKRKYVSSGSNVVRNDVLQIEYFERNFKKEDVIWDIGSHFGQYSIFAASVVTGENQVFSFEPDEAARAVQFRNISLNNLEAKIKVNDLAISNINGILRFKSEGGNANSHLINDDLITGPDIISVNSRTINSLLKDLPLPTFVKIDTEGAEINILNEACSLLRDDRVRFICELHPFAWPTFGSNFEQLLNLIEAYGRNISLLDTSRMKNELPFYGTILF